MEICLWGTCATKQTIRKFFLKCLSVPKEQIPTGRFSCWQFIPRPADHPSIYLLLENHLFVFPFMLNFLPTAANPLNFISVVKHLPFFFHLLPFSLPRPRVLRAGPGDRERAGPRHRDRSDTRDVGSSKICLWRCCAGSRAGIWMWAGGLKAQAELGDAAHALRKIWAHICSRVTCEHVC